MVRLLSLALIVIATSVMQGQTTDAAQENMLGVMKLPRGTLSIGVIGSAAFPVVSSDVVGANAPGESHLRSTASVGLQGGIELAWEFYRTSRLIVSLRGRALSSIALDAEKTVHQHADLVVVSGRTYNVVTDHVVRHAVGRADVQGLVGAEVVSVPLRFIGGLGITAYGTDRVEEIFTEVSRVAVDPIVKPSGHGEASVVYRIRERLGLIAGIEIPLRHKWIEVAVNVTADIGLRVVADDNIPVASHLFSAGILCALRF